MPREQRIRVDVDGRSLELSNLDKVLYPAVGFTKAEVINYYTRVAPVLLPHLRGRALTRKRYPNGVDGQSFFEKNKPQGTPSGCTWRRCPSPDPPWTGRRSTSSSPTTCPRWCGWPTSPRSNCTHHSGG
ncbi:hypothetical protein Prum_037010 [Phytohabitans rumicis]|uniref:DNA ligase D polymerase domain-containing protein n=1 Tax=Phytohabitans rumicis TaxID=1076125 RepID=A0A6V8L611_9ACTN|nr:hypothetical protein Prum_037010 [Phytohabitans rumicis]